MGGTLLNIGIILQARMCSTRLPGKVLKRIGDKTLLEHIFFRLSFFKKRLKVILATTTNPRDDILSEFCMPNNISCFRGSENDVLERYYICASENRFSHIVRLTADNPFVDIEELENLVSLHLESDADYTHSFGVLPVGAGAEIFRFEALEKSHMKGRKENHREHVNEYIQENPELFKIKILSVPEEKNRPDIRLTVDTEEDYKKACFIAGNAGQEYISIREAIRLCLLYA